MKKKLLTLLIASLCVGSVSVATGCSCSGLFGETSSSVQLEADFNENLIEKITLGETIDIASFVDVPQGATLSVVYTQYDEDGNVVVSNQAYDSLYFLTEELGRYDFKITVSANGASKELSCTIEVVVPAPQASEASGVITCNVGDTLTFDALFNRSNIMATPAGQVDIVFASVEFNNEVIDLDNYSSTLETKEIGADDTSYTFAKAGAYTFCVKAVNAEGEAETSIKVIATDPTSIPDGIAASGAVFGENNDTVKLFKGTRSNLSYMAYDTTYLYNGAKVRVEFSGNQIPQIMFCADEINGNGSEGIGYVATMEYNANYFCLMGPNRISGNACKAKTDFGRNSLSKNKRYVWDVYMGGEDSKADVSKTITYVLYEKNEDGSLTEISSYIESGFSYDKNTETHKATKEGYIVFLGSSYSDIIFKYYKPSANLLDVPELTDSGTQLQWTAVEGAIDYEVKVADGDWISTNGATNYDYSALEEGVYATEVRSVFEDGKSASAYIALYLGTVNTNPLALTAVGNTVSWNSRIVGGYNVTYEIREEMDVDWTSVGEATDYTLAGDKWYLNNQYTIYVRTVYELNGEITYSEESAISLSYNANNAAISGNTVTLTGTDRYALPYVAFEQTAENQWVRVDFAGKNCPNIRLGSSSVHGSQYAGNGVLITCDVYGGLRAYIPNAGEVLGAIDYSANIVNKVSDGTLDETKNYTMLCNLEKSGDNYVVTVYFLERNGEEYSLLNTVTTGEVAAERFSVDEENTQYIILMGTPIVSPMSFSYTFSEECPAIVTKAPENVVFNMETKTVTWDAVEGVDGYQVRIENGEWIDVTTNSHTFEGVADGAYNLYVRAVIGGVGGLSAEIRALFGDVVDAEALVLSVNGNTVSWTAREKTIGYQVKINDGEWQALSAETLSYTLTDGVLASNYTIAVKAIFADNAIEPETEEASVTVCYNAYKSTINEDGSVIMAGSSRDKLAHIGFEQTAENAWVRVDFEGQKVPNIRLFESTIHGNQNAGGDGILISCDSGGGLRVFAHHTAANVSLVTLDSGLARGDLDSAKAYSLICNAVKSGDNYVITVYVMEREGDVFTQVNAEAVAELAVDKLNINEEAEHYVVIMGSTYGDITIDYSFSADAPKLLNAVTGLSYTNETKTLAWDVNSEADSYLVRIDDGEWESVSQNSYDVSAMEEGVYTVYVRPVCDGVNGMISSLGILVGEVVDDSALVLTVNGDTVSWEIREKAIGYQVKVGDGEWSDTITETSYTLTSGTVGASYEISVKAIFASAESAVATKTITYNVHNATYDSATGAITLQAAVGGANYTDTSYVKLGSYEDGGYVAMEFTGKVAPQAAFFASEATKTIKNSAIKCIMFSSDVVTSDYRGFATTNPNTGAILANKWNAGAYANLDAATTYVLVVGATLNTENSKYDVSMKLYTKGTDATLTFVSEYSGSYGITDWVTSGTEIVLYGSRHSAINATVSVGASVDEVLKNYTINNGTDETPDEGGETPDEGETTNTVTTYKSTYDATTGVATFQTASGSTSYTDTPYIDFGSFANGGFVTMEFTGKYAPQVSMFSSGATATPRTNPNNCLMFSCDAIGSDYRVFKTTDPTTGAVLANKWKAAAYNNLDASTTYVLVVGATPNTEISKYTITLKLYTKGTDGTLTLVSEYSGDYSMSDFDVSGTHLVVYGSRITSLTATLRISETLDGAMKSYTIN